MARATLSAVLLALAGPVSLSGQSTTSASVTGTVRATTLLPVAQARVAMTPIGAGSAYVTSTSVAGSFSIGMVQPGSYEIRVEALGYRPLVARVLTIGGGEERSVSLTLRPEAPPVTQVDTVALPASASTRWRTGSLQLGGTEVDVLPHRFDDLASVAAMSTAFDEGLGSQGLPGDMTLIYADGVPFYRAVHPTARQELLPDGLFPRSALAGVTPTHHATDVELPGSAAGYVSLSTRTSVGSGGLEVDGSYAGKPTWSSGELDIEKPSLLSWQAGGRTAVAVSPSVRLVVSGEALSQETPLAPRVSDGAVLGPAALDPELVEDLSEPGVEQYDRFSGHVRLDWEQSRNSRLFFRGNGSFVRRDFAGAGPVSIAGPTAMAEESSDFSTAFGVTSQHSRTTAFEFRAGFSGSYRDFDGSTLDRAPAFLAESGAVLGGLHSAAAASNRTDFVAIPLMRWNPGGTDGATLKFGAMIRASSHSMSHTAASLGDYVYSDPAGLGAGSGFGAETTAPKAEFGTQEYGAFAQYEGRLAPTLRLRLGGRYDYELIGGDGVALNSDWAAATGIDNSVFDDSYHQFGVRGSMTWDPGANGRTRVIVSASMQEGDVDLRALSALHAEATEATSTRFAGTGIGWPDGGIPPLAAPARPALTMLGPDMRAPRTTNLEVGLIQRIRTLGTIFVGGSSRRTDFLTRRRNLNLPLVPSALDPYGRRIVGTLAQDGAVVTATADDGRRFAGFGEAYALDPDGWSEYFGLTAGIEHNGPRVDLYASYTYSETTDNWIGAGQGTIGAALPPGLPQADGEDPWAEGTSDFDVPHRAALGVTTNLGPVTIAGLYRFRSGLPFTPGYRLGVDANGDGSFRNDVAFVPSDGSVDALAADWSCLDEQVGGFAVRNSCRRPGVHTVNARLQFTFARFGGRSASLTLDAFNLLESQDGVIDDALMLVDPAGSISTSPDGTTVTIPTMVNPDFGNVVYPSTRGRMLRIGVRVGG